MPTLIDAFLNIVAYDQFSGEAGLGTGVDDDGSAIGKVLPHNCRFRGMDIGSRLKSRPGSPQKIGDRVNYISTPIVKYNQRPVRKDRFVCQSGRLFGVLGVSESFQN